MGYERFLNQIFAGPEYFLPGSRSGFVSFCLDPDQYQSSVWNRIRNDFF